MILRRHLRNYTSCIRMPFRAIIDGQPVISALLTTEEWCQLQARRPLVQLPCCNAPGHMRTSPGGIQHFYHASGSSVCNANRELLRHLTLKAEILAGVQDAGFTAETEVVGLPDRWRADVLASSDGKRIAFEVQLSSISLLDLADRHARYEAAGVSSVWLVEPSAMKRHFLRDRYPVGDCIQAFFADCPQPVFALNDKLVRIGDALLPVRMAITKWLLGEIRHVAQRRVLVTRSLVSYSFNGCSACSKRFIVYFPRTKGTPCCAPENLGCLMDELDPSPSDDLLSELQREAVHSFISRIAKTGLRLGIPEWRRVGGELCFSGFRCPYCKALESDRIWPLLLRFGTTYQRGSRYYLDPLEEMQLDTKVLIDETTHWCHVQSGRRFCV